MARFVSFWLPPLTNLDTLSPEQLSGLDWAMSSPTMPWKSSRKKRFRSELRKQQLSGNSLVSNFSYFLFNLFYFVQYQKKKKQSNVIAGIDSCSNNWYKVFLRFHFMTPYCTCGCNDRDSRTVGLCICEAWTIYAYPGSAQVRSELTAHIEALDLSLSRWITSFLAIGNLKTLGERGK